MAKMKKPLQRHERAIANARALRDTRGRKVGERSLVVDEPGHPVAAPCAIEHCMYFELFRALEVIHTAVRGDEKGQFWPLRAWLDEHGIFHDDLGKTERLIEAVCKHALHIP